MSRIGRFVVPDLPHHVTQRGNRREKVFFGDDDYALYRDLLERGLPARGGRGVGLLPDAEPRSSDPDARGRARASGGRSARRTGAIRPSSTRGCG